MSILYLAPHFLAIFNKVHEVTKTAFSARDQHRKVHGFVQNTVAISRSECFAIIGLGALVFSDFQQSARVCKQTRLQPEICTFCHFCTRRTNFWPFLQKCTSLCKMAFSAEIRTFSHFRQTARYFCSDFGKVYAFVQNSVRDQNI